MKHRIIKRETYHLPPPRPVTSFSEPIEDISANLTSAYVIQKWRFFKWLDTDASMNYYSKLQHAKEALKVIKFGIKETEIRYNTENT